MQIKKGFIAAVMLSVLLFSLAACNDRKAETAEPTPTSTEITETVAPSPTVALEYIDEDIFPDYFPESQYYPVYYEYTDDEIDMLAKTVWGEAGICCSEEWRLVIWTVLQRVDDDRFPDTIAEVITARRQFLGYHEDHPIDEEIRALCVAEVADWIHGVQPPTLEPYAPTAPYYFFEGDGRHNWYREEW